MKIGVVIPTRNERPEFLKHCFEQLDRQTRQPDRVVLVDFPPKSNTHDIHERYKEGYEKLSSSCDLIFFIEEDDYYSPEYLRIISESWNGEDLIGIDNTIYYNIHTSRYQYFEHQNHSSMFCTAMKGGLKFPSGHEKFVDALLWKTFKGKTLPVRDLAVGIKHGQGLIVSRGHSMNLKESDDGSKLHLLTKDSYEFYQTLKKKPKPLVAIVTGMWGRHDVFKLFAQGVLNLVGDTDIDYVCIVAGSEGEQSRKLAEGYGFHYIETPNNPLAEKMNKTIKAAREYNPDYVLCLGSDDVITPELMRVYQTLMKRGIDYIATSDFYFYNINNSQAMYWAGYREPWRKGIACGAGRLLSRRILNAWGWSIWLSKHNHILDNSMEDKLRMTPHTKSVFRMKDYSVFGIDIKSSTNMTPWQRWDNTEVIQPDKIKQILCVE